MKGFAKIELVLKFDAEDMYHAEGKIEEMYEFIRDAIQISHGAKIITTSMDATSFEEGVEGYEGEDSPY